MIGKLTGSLRYQDEECLLTVFLKDFTATNQHCYEADRDRYFRYRLVPLALQQAFIVSLLLTISFIVKLNQLLRSLEIIFEKARQQAPHHPHHNIVIFVCVRELSWKKDNIILTKLLYCFINFDFIQTKWERFP